ncbi:fatty acid desaturase [Salisediminibacterium beveridgei]|uniref:Fatty-acid desaturase n=1 Tax=Salisediminibacterium beveridgei TaxID=632773 RepID=A0A1D7QR04_9BACI|nr:fatty acid desaturase [Salisediminibacterium beveridgei]AOM81449.1 Fatty-acid desaturase [Salisediminibacterium beveridgei]
MSHHPKIQELKKSMKPFEVTDHQTSIKQLLNTLVPYVLLWALAYMTMSISYWLAVPIMILAAGFLVRTFIICHDCCHQSFFKSRRANAIMGTITGALTHVPFEQWKNAHNTHHASSSNLDKRGTGDMWIMTVDEYQEASLLKRVWYRIYRNPVMMFGIGPVAVFFIQYRFNVKGARRKERINTYLTNGLIASFYIGMMLLLGWQSFLLIQMPIAWLAGTLGIWLFYVQHQFEETYFEHDEEWSYVQAAIDGSSYYQLPKILQWLTGNIGYHHVHHLSPRVPNYKLSEAHEATPPLHHATTITLATSVKSLKYRLWDENQKEFITYKQAKDRMANQRLSVS